MLNKGTTAEGQGEAARGGDRLSCVSFDDTFDSNGLGLSLPSGSNRGEAFTLCTLNFGAAVAHNPQESLRQPK